MKFKKIFLFAMCAVMALSLAACSSNEEIGLPNPFTEYQTLEEAEKEAKFTLNLPQSIEGYNDQAERMLADYGNAVLESKGHEKAWLLRVASNLSKNRLKYNSARQTDELMEELIAEERDDLSFVWEAVKSLPEKFRVVIHLFYHEGYQTAQIARILDMKETTVRSNLARGREKLKHLLKEAYDFE